MMSDGQNGNVHGGGGAESSLSSLGDQSKQQDKNDNKKRQGIRQQEPQQLDSTIPQVSRSTKMITTSVQDQGNAFNAFGGHALERSEAFRFNQFPVPYDDDQQGPPRYNEDMLHDQQQQALHPSIMRRLRTHPELPIYEHNSGSTTRAFQSLSALPDFTERVPHATMHSSYPAFDLPETKLAGGRSWARLPSISDKIESSTSNTECPEGQDEHEGDSDLLMIQKIKDDASTLHQKSYEKLMHSSIQSFHDIPEGENDEDIKLPSPLVRQTGEAKRRKMIASSFGGAAAAATFAGASYQDYSSRPQVIQRGSSNTSVEQEMVHGLSEEQQMVFTEFEVKHSDREHLFFIAGRGGETNRKTNQSIREQILSYTDQYIAAPAKERGRVFARRLLQKHFSHILFVVRVSYFLRNRANGRISESKIASVMSAGHTLEALERLDENQFVTIGHSWAISNIADLLRAEAARLVTAQRRWLQRDPTRRTDAVSSVEEAQEGPVSDLDTSDNAAGGRTRRDHEEEDGADGDPSINHQARHKKRKADDCEPLPFQSTAGEEDNLGL